MKRPPPAARKMAVTIASVLFALIAVVLAATPWLGEAIPVLDVVAPAWPAAAVLAVVALAIGAARSVAAAIALVAIGLCIPTILALPRPDAAAAGGFRLRVVTHNVWVDNIDPAGTAAALAGSGADILVLQETNGTFRPFLPNLRRLFPYDDGCRYRCSLAILSRYPLDRRGYRFRDADGRQAGPPLLRARVRLPNGGFASIVTLHLPRGAPRNVDLARRESLVAAVARSDPRSMILAGDLNLVPWSVRLARLDDGLAPMRRATAAFSYPARVRGRAFPLPLVPIDHLYAGPGWIVTSVHRLPRTGSDHYAVAIDLNWQD